ncbi:MAG: hypothetical protein [Cressdnaviricota sp.]|nr:MAG: hypothetical protein [Cressdnaviricota sp.]
MDPYDLNWRNKAAFLAKHGAKHFNPFLRRLWKDYQKRREKKWFGPWSSYPGDKPSALDNLIADSKMPRNSTYVEPAGALVQGGDVHVGSMANKYVCSSRYGKRKRLATAPIVRKLMNYNLYRCQMLNNAMIGATGYRSQGSLYLRPRYAGVSTSYPRSIEYPVYIFRLNVPSGWSVDPNDDSTIFMRPLVAFRLVGTQNFVDDQFSYRWVPVTRASAPTVPVRFDIEQKDQDMYSTSVRHCYTNADVFVSGATAASADIEISIVKFSDEGVAPPDLFTVGNLNDPVVFRANSGYSATLPTAEDEERAAAFYDVWLHNRLAHPLSIAKYGKHIQGPAPFEVLQKHRMTLSSRDTTNADAGPVQYKHSAVFKAYRWHNTGVQDPFAIAGEPTTSNALTANIDQENVGMWLQPPDQRWLMVSGFVRSSIDDSSVVFSNLQFPSFDINLSGRFEFVNDPSTQNGPLRQQPVDSPKVEIVDRVDPFVVAYPA